MDNKLKKISINCQNLDDRKNCQYSMTQYEIKTNFKI